MERNTQKMRIIRTAEGDIRGVEVNGECTYFAFRGVPYAAPPIGDFRFAPPQPVTSWQGIRDAIDDPAVCPQFHMWLRDVRGEEDCLYLNVYTPYPLEDISTGKCARPPLYPVMVRLHGGGFTTGSGNEELVGPEFFMRENVVIVSINYRLGVLGFLCMGEAGDGQGNMGLKDQVAALKWIQRNIVKFGGDPSQVTLSGESAGGASVHYHMLSHMSKGLFHNAIMESGVSLNPWAYTKPSVARERAFRLGKLLGCETSCPEELLRFFRSQSPYDLVTTAVNVYTKEEKRSVAVTRPFPFVPCMEIFDERVEPFLSEEPIKILREGRFLKVPVLAGINSREGLLILAGIAGKELQVLERAQTGVASYLPDDLETTSRSGQDKSLAAEVLKFYFGTGPITEELMGNYMDLYGDLMFLIGFYQAVRIHVSYSPTFLYLFDFEGKLNTFRNVLGSPISGACHADELGYLFRMDLLPSEDSIDQQSTDVLVRSRMVRMWSNFARYGNPTPPNDSLLRGVTWPPATPQCMHYMHITDTLKVHSDMLRERVAFWERIHSTYSASNTHSRM